MMGKVNQERLAEYLGELQRKENPNNRNVAALKGETLTSNPYISIQPIPKPPSAPALKLLIRRSISSRKVEVV
ncbi:hypothetical protein MKX03_030816, partial [Papaver bracteatum]